ncbi:MAG: lysophospholipid acyltransferase family protein [Candidatus Omnitrophica bacterium]|nr:lysophospholipid acyltransferase family protein [Candidatus Omnitrophota bacterium]
MLNTIIYNFCCFLGIHLPLPFLYFIARLTAFIRYLFLRESRKNVIENLRIVLEYKKTKTDVSYTEKELLKLSRKTFYSFARCLTDFSYVPKWTLDRVRKKVKIENIEFLDEGLSGGKGVIALTAHVGNWELAGIVSSMLGYRVTAVAIPYLNPAVTNLYIKRRNTKGLEVILTGSNPKNILKALKENRILAVLGDRVFTEKGTKIPFMGVETAIPRGPATLAVRTGAMFVAGFFIMEGENYRFFFKKIPSPPSDFAEDEKINFLLLKGAEIIEKVILDYPDQWLTFTPLFNPPTETG